ncbi:MAG: hypothetical protein QOC83_1695 [Pseudonocardiales bacterium]|nr:hypothetical protein [Pseudonocardiales bacterium]
MPQLPSPGAEPPARPRSDQPADLGFTPQPRVRWLAPGMLARTGLAVAISEVFGAFADRRELQRAESGAPLDLSTGNAATGNAASGAGDEFWLDYVADIGDGFDGATTVASQLAADELELPLGDRSYPTRAGTLLVLGGDECYPVASSANYADRLVGPYRMMLPWSGSPRWLLALPGNHDWYDGLTSFLRQFCQQRWIGGWKTVQSRSYFAVKLPGGWWLWGIDVALGDDLDKPQLDYFRAIAKGLGPDDSIILCWAMPSWVESGPENPEGYAPLEFFERTVIPDRAMLRLSLSGDLHHYARYQGQDEAGQQKITAGGGGAYLYPTHKLPDELELPPAESQDPNKHPPVPYRLEQCYPSKQTSRGLRADVVGQVYRNPGFWAVPTALYLVIGTTLGRAFPFLGRDRWWVASIPALLLALVLVAGVWLGLDAFSGVGRRRNPLRRRLVGGGHTLAHLLVIVATVIGVELGTAAAGWESPWPSVAMPVAEALVGALLGQLVVGLYLLVADGIGPGVNTDELFSAQAIQDYKCFLRMRIAADGTLTVFPVKIERAVRWSFSPEDGPGADRRWFRPADGVEPVAELIEEPIVVTKRPVPDSSRRSVNPV